MCTQSGVIHEQREDIRIPLADPLVVTAELEGNSVSAELLDVSPVGAKFRFPEAGFRLTVSKGYQTDWTLHLPSGARPTIKAAVSWYHRFPEGYILGVRFVDELTQSLLAEIVRKVDSDRAGALNG